MPIRKTNFKRVLKQNSPKIFKALGVIGLVASTPLTIHATVKSVRACDKRKEELGVEKLPVGEIVKTSWKNYIPVASLMGASTIGIVNGERISTKRTALIYEACNAAEQTLADYKDQTIKQIGEKKEKEIEREVLTQQAEKVITENTEQNELLIQNRENGGILFYEPITGTLFYSTRNKVDKAFNELSAKMIREYYVDLGDLFDFLELKRVDACNYFGWNSSRAKTIEPYYMGSLDKETTTPYVVMSYDIYPTTSFMDDR